MEVESTQPPAEGNSPISTVTRAVIAINFARFMLSFSPRFEGTEASPGVADKIFALRLEGFRIDGVWLVISTGLGFLTMFYFLMDSKENNKAKTDAYLCIAWMVAFVIFVARAFLTGIIDFG